MPKAQRLLNIHHYWLQLSPCKDLGSIWQAFGIWEAFGILLTKQVDYIEHKLSVQVVSVHSQEVQLSGK